MARGAPVSLCPTTVLEWRDVLLFAMCWEVMYQIVKLALKGSPHPKIKQLGASYFVAFLNAAICSFGGLWAVMSLLAGDFAGRMVVGDAQSPYWPGGPAGELVYGWFAHCFLGWLVYDVVHIAFWYPKLGGADTVAHHVGFVCLTCLGSSHRILPLPVAWLLVGEISSLPLNIRWFLIYSGRGATPALNLTNYVFGLSFLFVRVVVYWAGVYHLLMYLQPALVSPPYDCSPLVVNTICFFIAAGACLNAYWMINIFKMAGRGGQKKKGT